MHKTVGEFMTSTVTSLTSAARLLDAALLVRRSGKRRVPVVDEKGKVVGIVSDRDVARFAPSILGHSTPDEYNKIFEVTAITAVMTKDPFTVTPESKITEAVAFFYEKKIGALPVVRNGELAGILTVTDMLGLLYSVLMEKESGGGFAEASGFEG